VAPLPNAARPIEFAAFEQRSRISGSSNLTYRAEWHAMNHAALNRRNMAVETADSQNLEAPNQDAVRNKPKTTQTN
jgi:hypothetical protein